MSLCAGGICWRQPAQEVTHVQILPYLPPNHADTLFPENVPVESPLAGNTNSDQDINGC